MILYNINKLSDTVSTVGIKKGRAIPVTGLGGP
jgi:hypothetical protein